MQRDATEGRSGPTWCRSDVGDPVANAEIGLSLRVTDVWMENISKRGYGELQIIHLHNRKLFHSF